MTPSGEYFMSEATSRQALHSVAMSSPSPNTALQDKTDDEIQAEILSIKKKFYDRMDLQVEKDLILEERERLDEEKRKLDIQTLRHLHSLLSMQVTPAVSILYTFLK